MTRRTARFVLATGVLLVGCEGRHETRLVEAVDITSDLHHRAKAGLFLPDREPLVMRLEGPQEGPRPYFRISGDFGALWVRSNEDSKLVVYFDTPLFYSHVQVAGEAWAARMFLEWPTHPVR